MIRDGIEYDRMPDSVDLYDVTLVRTPYRATASKLDLTRELIEAIHQEALDHGASRVWVGELSFQKLDDSRPGTQAYAYVAFLEGVVS